MTRASRHRRSADRQQRRANRRAQLAPGDLPLNELRRIAEGWIADGYALVQKFTCEQCGTRETIMEANVFCDTATCEECGHLTDLRVRGAGFACLLVGPSCFGHSGRPIRRCDVCQVCVQCDGGRLFKVGDSPAGMPISDLMAQAKMGHYPGSYGCSDCMEAGAKGGEAALMARMRPVHWRGDAAADRRQAAGRSRALEPLVACDDRAVTTGATRP